MIAYYEEDGISIFQADCREVLPTLSDVDLIFTSPPYNKGLRVDGKWSGIVTESSKSHRFRAGYNGRSDMMDQGAYEELHREILGLCWQTLSPGGAIFYNHKPRIVNGRLWTPLILNPGLPLRQIVTWDTGAGINIMPGAYVPAYQWIMIFAGSSFRLRSREDSALSDVWHVRPVHSREHPAPFPVDLVERAIRTTAPRTLLDPFMGTGAALIAAKRAGIRAIGIEREREYCDVAIQRLEHECATDIIEEIA
jgi:modification methylase